MAFNLNKFNKIKKAQFEDEFEDDFEEGDVWDSPDFNVGENNAVTDVRKDQMDYADPEQDAIEQESLDVPDDMGNDEIYQQVEDAARDEIDGLFATLSDDAKNRIRMQYSNDEDLMAFLNETDPVNAQQTLFGVVGDDDMDMNAIESFLDRYYQTAPNLGIYPAEEKQVDFASVNAEIKKLAQQIAKDTKLNKTAQSKTMDDNVIMWMGQNPYGTPSSSRVDPFTRQPVSDWHIVERNKGWGQNGRIGDVFNFDWETFWRGNIMDKYSRPYRDKEGNWVGGWLNKRFEVDSWIPEGNNYQLKPGQRRTPRLPEYGLTEGRLESMRQKEADSRGYAPTSSGEPFDWTSASQIADLNKTSNEIDSLVKIGKKCANRAMKTYAQYVKKAATILSDYLKIQSQQSDTENIKKAQGEYKSYLSKIIIAAEKEANNTNEPKRSFLLSVVDDLKKKAK